MATGGSPNAPSGFPSFGTMHTTSGQELPHFDFPELLDMKQLSLGFFSITYTARWKGLAVVVKKLNMREGVTIERETRTWKLHHPNVVKVLAVNEDELAILMEYVDGGDLRAFLSRFQPTLRQRMLYAVAVARGMVYLHECKLFHCDLKCDNIFIDLEENTAKIGDFGLVRYFEPKQRSQYKLRGWWNHRIAGTCAHFGDLVFAVYLARFSLSVS